MFNSVFDTSTAGLEINTALIAAGAALVMGLALAITQRFTSTTTKGFLVTLTAAVTQEAVSTALTRALPPEILTGRT